MADFTPAPSQENAPLSSQPSSTGGDTNSSPIFPTLERQRISKPRKAPTITPRSFTRFFTPKSSLERGGRIGASRQALRDITASASNRKGRRMPAKDTIQVLEDETEGQVYASKKRKRKVRLSPVTPELSSPLKRIRHQSLGASDGEESHADTTASEDESEEALKASRGRGPARLSTKKPIILSRYRSVLGYTLQREIGCLVRKPAITRSDRGMCTAKDWQYETANFSTSPRDGHTCLNLSSPGERSIPFCTASCNRSSLVAIGDEDGGVRLLESAKDETPPFGKAYVNFRPHANAILDLHFSPDDMLLATASGDQTARIIDMPTQTATYSLAGHISSVKQVRFQPESSSVIATCSRDGNVQIWDLRCKGMDVPVVDVVRVPLDPAIQEAPNKKMIWARSVNTIIQAHASRELSAPAPTSSDVSKSRHHPNLPSSNEPPARKGDVSITALSFLTPDRPHLLLTASEANASVKLWDLRTTHNARRRDRATPLSSTRQPGSHTTHRHFGLTSLSLSANGSRLYTLCRDNTVYAYSTSHLVLGYAPELSTPAPKPRRSGGGPEKEGLGPLYGFRHPMFHATSFYVKSTLRPARDDKTELLAVGSSDGCAVLFPTDERYIHRGSCTEHTRRGEIFDMSTVPGSRLKDTVPIYQHGTALVRGHGREVTGLSWTMGGELVTVGDDYTARCWRESSKARGLRVAGEAGGERWAYGWADVGGDWDDSD